MPRVDGARLLADLTELRKFGACGTGVVRLSFSEADMAARHWLRARMRDAGLDAELDGVGNVIGRSPNHGPALLLGSHSDTQPTGGWLDGAMGVIYAIEVARALRETPETRDLAVDVAAWVDEEGSYLGFLGSRAFCGENLDAEIAAARSADGKRLTDVMASAGITGRPATALDRGRHIGYLEAHIEQGPYLESDGLRVGVVTGIVGIRELEIVAVGQQNHAGTTPMPQRRDAGAALIDLAHRIQSTIPRVAGPRSVWTIGRMAFQPGSRSIIPGRAELSLQFRDPDDARLDAIETEVGRLVAAVDEEGTVEVSLAQGCSHVAPVELDAAMRDRLAEAAQSHAPGKWTEMPSAAGHDAQVLACYLPSAMLFVPSKGGISHDFAEDTDEDDIVLGCQVMATAVEAILRERTSGS